MKRFLFARGEDCFTADLINLMLKIFFGWFSPSIRLINDFEPCFMLAGFKRRSTIHLRHVNDHDSWTRADGNQEEKSFSDLDCVVEFSNCSETSQFLN